MTKDHCRRTSRSQDASDLLQLVRIHSWLEEEKQKKEEEEEGEVYKMLSPKSTMRLFIPLVDKSQQRYVTALQLSCNLTHIYRYIYIDIHILYHQYHNFLDGQAKNPSQ